MFHITKIDSILHDKRGFFINAREYKDLRIECEELAATDERHEKYDLFLITKYAHTDTPLFSVRLKGFYDNHPDDPFVLQRDTVLANNISFTNYYSFRPYNYDAQKDPASVVKIYISPGKGIVAYRYLNGAWWTKMK
jgi:hypothetical protein